MRKPPLASNKKAAPRRRVRRVNFKGIAILGGVILLLLLSYFPARMLADRGVRRTALDQARANAAAGDEDLAIRQLRTYLATSPDDVEALEIQARLLARTARTGDQIREAMNVNDQLVRLDPAGEGRQETRRELVRLYILYGKSYRQMVESSPGAQAGDEVMEGRFRAALTIARQVVEKEPADVRSHRLLASALEAMVDSGEAKFLAEAVDEYARAVQLDPKDAVSAERLANLYQERKADLVRIYKERQKDLNKPVDPKALATFEKTLDEAPEKTLDDLLKALPGSPEPRMARFRLYARMRKPDRALVELEAAVAAAPADVEVRRQAVEEYLRRGDLAAARRHIDAIPAADQSTLPIRVLRGMLDFAGQNPDDAVEEWRKGLSTVGGGDANLTFQLAYKLIQLNRLAEARPLLTQYQRLVGDEKGDEKNFMGRFLRAQFELKSGHPGAALKELEKVRAKVPKTLTVAFELAIGRSYEAIGNEPEAMKAYRAAATAAPVAAEPRREIARMLRLRNPQQAIGELDRALAQTPDNAGLLIEAARLHLLEQMARPQADRRWEKFEESLARAERVASGDFVLRLLRAQYLSASGRLREATEQLARDARGPDHNRLEAWASLAVALERQGRLDEAIRVLEEGSTAEAAGDHALLRRERARLLARAGKGQAAREVLSKGRDKLPRGERPELARYLGNFLRDMGDRDGARVALADWARQAPDSPEPGLALLSHAQTFGDDEAARLGLEALRGLGGDQEKEPYSLAARAIELLRPEKGGAGATPADKLNRAEGLVKTLQEVAPDLPIGHLLKAQILERGGHLAEAATSYRKALKDENARITLPLLVEVLMKAKRHDDIAALKRDYENTAVLSGQADAGVTFDRMMATVALKLGDKERAEFYAAQIAQGQPENVQARITQARLLAELNKPAEGEAILRELADRRPNDRSAWAALVSYQVARNNPAEVARTIEKARATYKGDQPDLLEANCRWLAGDTAAATRLYAAAVARRPDDLTTIREAAEFDEAIGRTGDFEAVLRRALKVDPSATWASRSLAFRLAARRDSASWAEAWSLIAPGASGTGDAPDDRLTRAIVLTSCPDPARRAEAESALGSLIEDLPITYPYAVEARARLAQILLESDRTAEAAAILVPVSGDDLTPNSLILGLATEALARSGRGDEARRRLDRLAALEPKSTRFTAARTWVLVAEGKAAEAAAVVDSASVEAEAAPGGESTCLAYFDLLDRIGQPAAAEKAAGRFAARWPRDAYLLVPYQIRRGRFAEALASCRAALAAGSTLQAVQMATALASLRHDDPAYLKQLDALADTARAQAPKLFDVNFFVATLRHVEGRYADELTSYNEALAAKPASVAFLNNMAWTLSEGLNRPADALVRVDEVIRREGRSPSFLDTRGVILTRLGRLDEAIATLEESSKLDPSASTFFHLARVYQKAGKDGELQRCRELARKARFDPATLDTSDRADAGRVMGNP